MRTNLVERRSGLGWSGVKRLGAFSILVPRDVFLVGVDGQLSPPSVCVGVW